ncbi:MAG: sigma-54-dependent Fis family transcriptional regulator [Candidatus Omnitrophica bacterium]|nr:sigma-54-dependent Fis family transcriptional regulator [Candidatus Omnitrophota bacterium]
MSKRKILIIDDEPEMGWIFSRVLEDFNCEVHVAKTGEEGITRIQKDLPDLVFLDVKLPKMDGIETLSQIRTTHKDLLVIMLTAYETVKTAVEAMKLGAYDYLTKPIPNDRLKIIIEHALQTRSLSLEVGLLKAELQKEWNIDSIVGNCLGMQEVINSVRKVAGYDVTVLIRGESGTGKELVARAIHYASPRANKPFVAVDCATLPEALVESELFGYEKGAFTGADYPKLGRFEMANEGTIFMDEIGNMSPHIQVKLLRVLQEREIEHLGGKKPIKVNARVIAATNVDLENAIRQGKFRDDLYHRLNVFSIFLPPLRERGDDVVILSKYFLQKFNKEFDKDIKGVSKKVMELFKTYQWPGNARELENTIKSAIIMADDEIELSHLPNTIRNQSETAASPHLTGSLKEMVKNVTGKVEKEAIVKALKEAHWNKRKAARKLSIDYKTLYNKINEYDIATEDKG